VFGKGGSEFAGKGLHAMRDCAWRGVVLDEAPNAATNSLDQPLRVNLLRPSYAG
jgi:hypothetical protein